MILKRTEIKQYVNKPTGNIILLYLTTTTSYGCWHHRSSHSTQHKWFTVCSQIEIKHVSQLVFEIVITDIITPQSAVIVDSVDTQHRKPLC